MKAVGILGVSGSLAQALLSELEIAPEVARVVGIDVHPPRLHPSKLEFHPADIRHAPLAELLRGVDTVFHLAVPSLSPGGALEPGGAGSSSHLRRVATAVRDCGARRLVMVTSIAAYGAHANNPVPIQEWQALRPNPGVAHSESWVEVERTLDALESELRPLELVRLRSALVVGPSVEGNRARLLSLDRVVLARAFDPKIQLIHEEDLARACRRALQEEAQGIYHVAGGEPLPVSALYEAAGAKVYFLPGRVVRGLCQIAWRLGHGLVPPELLEMGSHPIVVSTTRIRRDLGWEARYSTREAFLKAREALKGR